jgi:Ca2+-binding RTX toxin-like protein
LRGSDAGSEQFLIGNHGANLTQVYGEGGNDFINADGANEVIQAWGGAGNDTIIGGRLGDTLRGGSGDDWLRGGLGNDFIYGDAGADQFFFHGTSGNDHLAAYHQNGRIIARRSAGSYTNSILELDSFFQDASDFFTLDGRAGNDTMKVNANVGSYLGGQVIGGTGFDTVDFLPSDWDEFETEG